MDVSVISDYGDTVERERTVVRLDSLQVHLPA